MTRKESTAVWIEYTKWMNDGPKEEVGERLELFHASSSPFWEMMKMFKFHIGDTNSFTMQIHSIHTWVKILLCFCFRFLEVFLWWIPLVRIRWVAIKLQLLMPLLVPIENSVENTGGLEDTLHSENEFIVEQVHFNWTFVCRSKPAPNMRIILNVDTMKGCESVGPRVPPRGNKKKQSS